MYSDNPEETEVRIIRSNVATLRKLITRGYYISVVLLIFFILLFVAIGYDYVMLGLFMLVFIPIGFWVLFRGEL